MKQIIPFTKDIKFNTKIYEITSISLENTLTIEENNNVDGEFIVSGEYKMNDSSINSEPFIYGLPFDITLDEDYDTDKLKIDVDDFKFEIINEEILRVNIDVLIEGTLIEKESEKEEKLEPDVIIDARKQTEETTNISKNLIIKEENEMTEEKDLFKEIETKASPVLNQTEDNKVTSIFENFNSTDEKYISYYVHIVRQNDTIDSISSKYKVSIEDIKEYNDIDQITLGNKIIIPYIENDETI